MGTITYFSESISFVLPHKRKLTAWIKHTIAAEGYTLLYLNYIFCTDEYLLQINRDYLNHDYFTDIVTFDQADIPQSIEGDIYISIDRVKDNATNLHIDFLLELYRVMIHGVLHLCGYDDHTDSDRLQMRSLENSYLKNI